MKILFGMYLDGVAWSCKSAAIGEVRTGPVGFLGILEARLGISKPQKHPVQRINEYMNRVQSIDNVQAWFHKSFSVDPWSTSRQLLGWRDELVEAGWKDNTALTGSARLEAIAAIEKTGLPLSQGRPERIRDVIRLLRNSKAVDIASVQLLEPMSMLPKPWQEIMGLLESKGTEVSNCEEKKTSDTAGNMPSVKAILNGADVHTGLSTSDESLVLLKADDEWEAAEHLALWLASDPKENDQVTIICGKDTGILDHALVRHGLPRLGRSDPSRWREIQQILPLVLANAWKPVDIRLLVELLSLTSSPFPRYVCRSLLNAISKEPGVSGSAWNSALAEIAEKRQRDLVDKGDSEAVKKAGEYIEEISSVLVEGRYDPNTGIPEEKLRSRCQRVIEWLAWQIDSTPAFAEVIGQAREIQKLSAGKGSIPRNTLERMLDDVIGAGSISVDITEEAGPWCVIDHPGQLVAPCGDVVWWGFNDLDAVTPAYWSKNERDALEESGIRLENSWDSSRREAYAWQRALLRAEKHFVAYYISRINGAESSHHPYWDTLWCAAAQAADSASEEFLRNCLIRNCGQVDRTEAWEFAGRRNTLEKVLKEESASPAVPIRMIPPSVIQVPEKMSYSQMSTLIGCPMKWTLEYHAGLRLPENQVIPTGNQMIGTFCHRIIAEIYAKSGQVSAEAARTAAEVLFDELLPSMASELLLDGNAVERQRCRRAVTDAIRQLAEAINRLKLRVEKTEAFLEAEINGISFQGYSDLLLRDSDGNPYILDLKWSSSSKYRLQELKEGTSLQLVAYAWLLSSAEQSERVHTGYFMLAQGQLLSDSPRLSDEPVTSPYSLDEIWNMGVAGLTEDLKQLRAGVVEVRGIKERLAALEDGTDTEAAGKKIATQQRARGLLYQSPPCSFCDFKGLCGISGGAV